MDIQEQEKGRKYPLLKQKNLVFFFVDRFVIITDLVILLKGYLVKSFEMKAIKVLFNRNKQLM